jgi:uncharacterized protein YecE (DUF72 family)
MIMPQGQFRIGTSGYQYEHWKGRFYPHELRKKDWFIHYARNFDTVEINNTFYRLPSAETFESWRKQAPQGFCYALKFSRYGSHMKRLKAPRSTIRRFLQAAGRLAESLGVILVQLPPNWKVDQPRLEDFILAAPRSVRWAFEFRDPTWLCEEIFAILRRHNAALCIHDLIDKHPRQITADWIYLRFHGDHYGGNYAAGTLKTQARWIRHQLGDGKDIFAYFYNDLHGYAVRNAAELRHYVLG